MAKKKENIVNYYEKYKTEVVDLFYKLENANGQSEVEEMAEKINELKDAFDAFEDQAEDEIDDLKEKIRERDSEIEELEEKIERWNDLDQMIMDMPDIVNKTLYDTQKSEIIEKLYKDLTLVQLQEIELISSHFTKGINLDSYLELVRDRKLIEQENWLKNN